MSIERIELNRLVPLAKYVLQNQVEFLDKLQTLLLEEGHDLFDLRGRVTWQTCESLEKVAPPVVELSPQDEYFLVDGLHRAWLARLKQMESISCILIRNVELPLVPLPTSWDEIATFAPGCFPKESEKREYRFNSPEEVRRVLSNNTERVTLDNFRYYCFRDLRLLGSSGIRDERKFQ